MSQEIEIEFKTVLTKESYDILKDQLPFPKDAGKQINHYFETHNFSLKQQHSALRIREKAGGYTLTLKQPHPEGILETHDRLSEEEFSAWVAGRPINKPHTATQLSHMEIQTEALVYYGALTTERTSFEEDGILYVLDKSEYLHQTDYELEIESPTYAAGETAFHALLERFGIEKQPPVTKIERFFRTLEEMD